MKINNKMRLIAGNSFLFFGQSFYLSCSNSSCLKDGNSYEFMYSLLIAYGASFFGMGLGFVIDNYVQNSITKKEGEYTEEWPSTLDENNFNITESTKDDYSTVTLSSTELHVS